MIKATKNGTTGIFSDADWKSGQPQRYGWQEEGKEGKTLPKEIIQFIERRKAPPPEPVKDEPTIQIVKENKKKNDNPKQKVRATAKRKPRGVAKT